MYKKGGVLAMFKGEFSHTIDSKGRMIIPAKMREQLGENCVVTRYLDNTLAIYTQEKFEEIAKKLSAQSSNKSAQRAFVRFFVGGAADLEFDKQGRVLIPSNLRKHAQLKKDAIIVGNGERIEVWNKARWDAYNDEIYGNIEELAEELDLDDIGF